MRDYFYIYDKEQYNFYIALGLPVVEVGIGYKGDVYVKFKADGQCQEAFNKWKAFKKSIKDTKQAL